jgi:hypothetical protein
MFGLACRRPARWRRSRRRAVRAGAASSIMGLDETWRTWVYALAPSLSSEKSSKVRPRFLSSGPRVTSMALTVVPAATDADAAMASLRWVARTAATIDDPAVLQALAAWVLEE